MPKPNLPSATPQTQGTGTVTTPTLKTQDAVTVDKSQSARAVSPAAVPTNIGPDNPNAKTYPQPTGVQPTQKYNDQGYPSTTGVTRNWTRPTGVQIENNSYTNAQGTGVTSVGPKTWERPTGVQSTDAQYTYAATGKGVSSVPEQYAGGTGGTGTSGIDFKALANNLISGINTGVQNVGGKILSGGTKAGESPGAGTGGYTGGGGGGGTETPSAPTVDTGETVDTGGGNQDAADAVSRILKALDMSKQIGETNTAVAGQNKNTGNALQSILNTLKTDSNQNINAYSGKVDELIKAFSEASSGNINNYQTQSNANTENYSKTAQDIINNFNALSSAAQEEFARSMGMTVDQFRSAMQNAAGQYSQQAGQNINEYQQAGQAIIDQLKGITGPELAKLAEDNGLTISQTVQQINDIINSLQANLPKGEAGRVGRVDTIEQENLLKQIVDSQKQQSENSINYATEQGINELQRAMEDAQPQFQTERNQISAAERNAMDNQALYSEMRGDRGGIGQAQYGAIQNTAATNQLKVNQAQTKLATDTSRQIADLRAQGEFKKADALLEITQSYLSELMQLKKWADEMNVGIDEFNIGVEEWEADFNRQVQSLLADVGINAAQWAGTSTLENNRDIAGKTLDAAFKEATLGSDLAGNVATMRDRMASNLLDVGTKTASDIAEMMQNASTTQANLKTEQAGKNASLGMDRASNVASMRDKTLSNVADMTREDTYRTTSMGLDKESNVTKMRQDLDDALASFGINNTKYMNDAEIQRLTNTLNAYMDNAKNLSGTELTAANVFGADSTGTETAAQREASLERAAKAGAQMIEAGVTPTDQQLKALGWTKPQYESYKAAIDAANAVSSSGGSYSSRNRLTSELQAMVDAGYINEKIEKRLEAGVKSGLYSDANGATKFVNDLFASGYQGWNEGPDS